MLSFAGPEAGAAPTLLLSPTTHTPGACSTALVQGSWAASARGASDWDAVLEPGAPEGVPWVRAAAPAAGCGTPVAGEGDAVRPSGRAEGSQSMGGSSSSGGASSSRGGPQSSSE